MVVYESSNFRVVEEDGLFYPEEENDDGSFEPLTTPDGIIIRCDTIEDAIYYELGDF